MLKIRLQRVGRKHDPVFRVVLTDSRHGPKSGKFNEVLGSYDPRRNDKAQLKEERVKYWISQGAQTSGTVHNLLVNKKIVEGKKVNVLPKKKPIVKEKTDLPAQAGEEKKAEATEGGAEATKEEESSSDTKAEEVKEEEKPEEASQEEPQPEAETQAPKEESGEEAETQEAPVVEEKKEESK